MKASGEFGVRRNLRHLGPGPIGFSMLWTVVFKLPLMVAIWIVAPACHAPRPCGQHQVQFSALCLTVVGMVLAANTLDVAAKIAAMAVTVAAMLVTL